MANKEEEDVFLEAWRRRPLIGRFLSLFPWKLHKQWSEYDIQLEEASKTMGLTNSLADATLQRLQKQRGK